MTGYIKKASLAMAVSHTVREDNIQREFARQLAHNAVMDNTIAKDRSKPKPKKKSLTKTASLMTAIEALSGYNLASRAGLSATKEVAEQRNELLQNAGVNPVDHLTALDDIRDARRNIMASRPVPVVINSAISGAVSGLSTLRLLRGFGVPGNGPANYALGVGGAAALISAARAIYRGRQDGEAIGGLRDKVDGNVQAALNISSTIDPRVTHALYGGYDHINRDGELLKKASDINSPVLARHAAGIKAFTSSKQDLIDDINYAEFNHESALYKNTDVRHPSTVKAHKELMRAEAKYHDGRHKQSLAGNSFVQEASGGKFTSMHEYESARVKHKDYLSMADHPTPSLPKIATAGAAGYGLVGGMMGSISAIPEAGPGHPRLSKSMILRRVSKGAKIGSAIGAVAGIALSPFGRNSYAKKRDMSLHIRKVDDALKHYGITKDHFDHSNDDVW